MGGLPPQDLWHRYEVYFQPEALNEVLKEFKLKLTPMSFFCAPTKGSIHPPLRLRIINGAAITKIHRLFYSLLEA